MILILLSWFIGMSSPSVASQLEPTQCLGHKGNTEVGFPNSMAAFVAAYFLGADGVELDIRHTSDGVAVVTHDQTLNDIAKPKHGRICALDTKIRDLTFADIRYNCALKNGENIPTLQEVFEKFNQKKFTLLVEFEDYPKKSTFDLIRRYYGDHPERVRLCGVKPIFTVFRMKLKRMFSNYWNKIEAYVTEHRIDPVSTMLYDGVDVNQISDNQARHLLNMGKTVSVWTYNDEASIRRFMNLGVQYITTDSLSTCVKVRQDLGSKLR